MAESGPLRDGCHLHHAERDADAAAQHQTDGDPFVVDDSVVQQSAGDGQHHADLTCPNPVAGGGGRTHPFQRQNKKRAGDQVDKFDDVLASGKLVHDWLSEIRSASYLLGRLLLNIFSMRSVIKNPPTTLLVAATMAITPSTVANSLLRSPTSTMAPTTAMASSALVSDISGVCSKGETWRMSLTN